MRPIGLLALALVLSPSLLLAQASDSTCIATAVGAENAGNRPTCGINRNATTTLTSILRLALVNGAPIDLQATDTLAYEKTRTAAGGTGTTGTAVATPASLQVASARDSVIVLANRPYILTIAATTNDFKFNKDASGYNVCRNTPVSTNGCAATGEAFIAKPIGDLYWSGGAQAAPIQITGPATPATVRTKTTGGERYATGIAFKSAWFYDTDIPGVYTATVRYTVTGQ